MKKKSLLLITFVLLIFTTACGGKTVEDKPLIETVRDSVSVPAEVSDYELPTLIDGVVIAWFTSVDGTLTQDFEFIQSDDNVDITLTASFTYESSIITKRYTTTVLALPDLNTDEGKVAAAKTELSFDSYNLTGNITLPVTISGVNVSWSSNDSNHISSTGLVTRPEDGEDDATVILTATLSLNDETATKSFTFKVYAKTATVVYEGYYDGAEGLSGDALKTFLHNLIDDHTVISYAALRQALQDSDEDPNNSDNIILLYTGVSIPSVWNFPSWNREHVWPKGHGGFEDDTAGSDMHHIRPTNVNVNGDRGSLDFDEGGSLVDETTDCYKDGDSFEPRDEVKGDVARMMFYMAVRYEGDDDTADLELVDYTGTSGPYLGDLDILLQWHLQDPVDDFEIHRNNVIFNQYQHNRNPFIDHPEFVFLLWG